MKLSSIKIQDRPQKILVYGAPKTGKTLLVGKLAEQGYNLYWFDGDNGIDVLFQLSPEAQERVNVYPVRDLGEDQEFAKLSNEFAGYRNFSVCNTHGKVNCVSCKAKGLPIAKFDWDDVRADPKAVIVFDSITQLVGSVQNYIARNDSFDDFGKVDKESKREWGHYMAQGLVMGKFFAMVQNAPCKIVCISHETELDPEKNPTSKVTIPTGGTSTQSKAVSKYFGHVVHCRVRNNVHKTVSGTTSDPNAVAGSRLNIVVDAEGKGLAAMFEMEGTSVEPTLQNPKDSVTVTVEEQTKSEGTTSSALSQIELMKARLKK